ncbi:MAG: SDR family NAD(P)-dependent oxidoreductase, partial [Paracoccus sp. (in: a-proteobacteria)]
MRALVLGASGGIGAAVCDRLARDGARVTRLSRRDDGLDLTDPTTPGPLAARLERPFDLIFNATGALVIGGHEPEKSFAAIDAQAMA